MSRVPLQQLQGFLSAARLRNLSRAAESQNLTVSALSHQIRALEERLGQRLFVRGPRGITLTADGERLHDAVAVHCPGTTVVPLFDDWITPVASPSLIAAHGGDAEAFDIARYPLLGDTGGRWVDWCTRFGGTAPTRYVAMFNDTETLHRAATAGMGVALGRMTLARPLIEAGLLKALSPHRMKSEYAHYLVYPARSDDHAGLVAFRDWVIPQARSYAAALDAESSRTASRKPR